MISSIAFLRGMNLGRRRITNVDLTAAFEGLGFDGVWTYRASGNVVFEDAGQERTALVQRIEDGLGKALAYEVPTVLRSAEELAAIVAFEPFTPAELDASTGKVQVTLLGDAPDEAARAAVLAHATTDDRLAFGPSELYWLPIGRMSDSELDTNAIHKVLGLNTTRTLGTLQNILEKLG